MMRIRSDLLEGMLLELSPFPFSNFGIREETKRNVQRGH